MENHLVKNSKWLCPLSLLYGMGVGFRNMLFDWKIIRSKCFGIPIICVGNIAVGGTGKTPHTEYLIRLLQNEFAVAVLSRGYKRRTKGYVLAEKISSAEKIGDEPFQIKTKFPDVQVAVDEKRVRGVKNLIKLKTPGVDVILLDDGFQHRYIEPGLSILLTDYHRLFSEDMLLPAGRLREPAKAKNRAHIVIVTKCPEEMKPIAYNIISKQLKLYPYQKLFFSTFRYGNLKPVFADAGRHEKTLCSIRKDEHILLVTGIASPTTIEQELKKYSSHISTLFFADHHQFKSKDIKLIIEEFEKLNSKKIIVTTEKDATRLIAHTTIPIEIKQQMYALPIETNILQGQEETFNQIIIDYVRKNKRNNNISEE